MSARLASEEKRMAKFCTKCGAALDGEVKFCTKCGTPVIPPPQSNAEWSEPPVQRYRTEMQLPEENDSRKK